MRPLFPVAALLLSIGCRTPTAAGPGAKMDECRDFMCSLEDGPLGPDSGVQVCHPTTCAKKRAWEEHQRKALASAPSGRKADATPDAGAVDGGDVGTDAGQCFKWEIDEEDGSLGVVPVACPKPQTEEEAREKAREETLHEIRQRTGLQRF